MNEGSSSDDYVHALLRAVRDRCVCHLRATFLHSIPSTALLRIARASQAAPTTPTASTCCRAAAQPPQIVGRRRRRLTMSEGTGRRNGDPVDGPAACRDGGGQYVVGRRGESGSRARACASLIVIARRGRGGKHCTVRLAGPEAAGLSFFLPARFPSRGRRSRSLFLVFLLRRVRGSPALRVLATFVRSSARPRSAEFFNPEDRGIRSRFSFSRTQLLSLGCRRNEGQ